MMSDSTHPTTLQREAETAVYLFDNWFDPIAACVREPVREFIQGMIEGELEATLLRPRYGRLAKNAVADGAAGGWNSSLQRISTSPALIQSSKSLR